MLSVVLCTSTMMLVYGAGVMTGIFSEKVPLTEDEKSMLIGHQDFRAYFKNLKLTSKDFKVVEKKKNIDGSVNIEYEFTDPLGRENFNMWATLCKSGKTRDSRLDMMTKWKGMVLGLNIRDSDIDVVEKGSVDVGDESLLALIEYADCTTGCMLRVRSGDVYMLVLMTGVYFSEMAPLKSLLADKVKKMKSWGKLL